MRTELNLANRAKVLLVLIHFFGVIGMLSPFKAYFLLLTPFNLLISLVILVIFHPERKAKFYLLASAIMILGFGIEVIGVNTGFPFGDYRYGSPLGPKLLGTPFLIGVNWFIMSYCGALLFKDLTKYKFLNALSAGIAITLLDTIMEPVAIYLDFWTWKSEAVPIQNYLTWGICITLFSMLIYSIENGKSNRLANWVLGTQIFFFAAILIAISI